MNECREVFVVKEVDILAEGHAAEHRQQALVVVRRTEAVEHGKDGRTQSREGALARPLVVEQVMGELVGKGELLLGGRVAPANEDRPNSVADDEAAMELAGLTPQAEPSAVARQPGIDGFRPQPRQPDHRQRERQADRELQRRADVFSGLRPERLGLVLDPSGVEHL